MPHDTDIVRKAYDASVQKEWARLEAHPYEFEINKRFISKYVKPGDRVLDVGGGPGRYSLWLASLGCDVTLLDLSPQNVAFAISKAAELGLNIHAVAGDAREAAQLAGEGFDHVLLMGPLYHLTEEADRVRAVESCLEALNIGGTLSAAFISMYGGLVYDMRDLLPALCSPDADAAQLSMFYSDFDLYDADMSMGVDAFTRAYFILPRDVLPFFARFPLEKLHLLGSEGFIAPFSHNVDALDDTFKRRLLDSCERCCEREELLSYSEHLLYIGRRKA